MMENKEIQSDAGTISYWIGGNTGAHAKCIVFIHGMTADHTMYNKQVEYFRNEYRIITLDVPLHGESRPYINFSLYNVAKEVKNILDMEKINKVILVGQSMGGYISQEIASHYPEKVSGFIAVDSNPFGHYYYAKWERYVLSKVAKICSFIPYKLLVKSIVSGATKTRYAYQNLYNSISKFSKKEIIYIMDQVYMEFLKREKRVSFDFPVLLVIGEEDHTGNMKKYNKKWAELEGYPSVMIGNAGHNSNVDNYKEFNSILADFLNRL